MFSAGHLALNWSSIFSFFPFSIRHPHTHSHFCHKHTTCLCHISSGCLASCCSSLASPSVCWLSMASAKIKSGAVLLHCSNADGLMKPPTQRGHCLKGCTSTSLPSGVTQVEQVSRQPRFYFTFCANTTDILADYCLVSRFWPPLTITNHGDHSICSGVAIQIWDVTIKI